MRRGSESRRQAQGDCASAADHRPGEDKGSQGSSAVAQGLAGGDQGKGLCFLGDGEARTGGRGGMGSPRNQTGAW